METCNTHYRVVEQVIKFLDKNRIHQPSLEDISNHVCLSKFHLQRVFQDWAGVTPKQFLQYLTVEHSKSLLLQGKSTLETSYEVGLSGNGRLHDLFVKCEAVSPGAFKNKGEDIRIQWQVIQTVFGDTLIAETPKGICKVSFLNPDANPMDDLMNDFPKAHFKKALGKNGTLLKSYFDTWQVPHDRINLHFKGTPFQIQVWKALLQIPVGALVAYQDIGYKIGNPKAVRAIGTAIGKNPIAYLIPCHRVIQNNGFSGHYRWQDERKKIINAFESAHF
ncbi:bifunctional helix-turn-helix domain-containing protein/methylated-DNA--[protein]-cysteine S-methyltransferase [Aestuariivivens sediminis]|uniref:bifunctional helix-turn-helix domain-containing protein/methylated-DNA--[protein]-cysteine S-methyltransferase n=1 Tax=Aestuariivivens sediminis TaxID=2913557 RepID=UPI001F5A59D7|nr:methylated-DNA--[protein]-cysteine S-methyltransferase [Aestuariivivens sediminis]